MTLVILLAHNVTVVTGFNLSAESCIPIWPLTLMKERSRGSHTPLVHFLHKHFPFERLFVNVFFFFLVSFTGSRKLTWMHLFVTKLSWFNYRKPRLKTPRGCGWREKRNWQSSRHSIVLWMSAGAATRCTCCHFRPFSASDTDFMKGESLGQYLKNQNRPIRPIN